MIPNGLAEIIAFYGDPRKNRKKWEGASIVKVPLPFDMTLAWCTGCTIDHVMLHCKVADDFNRRMNLVWQHAQEHVKNQVGWHTAQPIVEHKALEWLHSLGLTLWGGGFNYRTKRSNPNELSVHSFGGAFDINPIANAMGTEGCQPDWYVDIWTKPDEHGDHWVWGGIWNGKSKDPQHIQFCKGY